MKQFELGLEGEDVIPVQNGGSAFSAAAGSKFSEAKTVGELNALQTLLEDRYMNKV